jgi:chaperonin GroES
MKLRPLNDFVLVRREKSKDVSDGGIILPEQAKRKSRTGEVLAVGPGRFLDNGTRLPVGIEPGQVVYFRGTVGLEIQFDNEDLVMLREDEIEGIVDR